jgi:hypothetical protein
MNVTTESYMKIGWIQNVNISLDFISLYVPCYFRINDLHPRLLRGWRPPSSVFIHNSNSKLVLPSWALTIISLWKITIERLEYVGSKIFHRHCSAQFCSCHSNIHHVFDVLTEIQSETNSTSISKNICHSNTKNRRIRGTRRIHIGFWWESQKERDH